MEMKTQYTENRRACFAVYNVNSEDGDYKEDTTRGYRI